MATIQGTLQGVKIAESNPSGAQASGVTAFQMRRTFLCTMSFASAVTADFGSISGLASAIQKRTLNGRTFTITHAAPAFPGEDASGNGVFITGTVTAGVTAGQVDFALGGPTAAAQVSASNGCGLYVTGYES